MLIFGTGTPSWSAAPAAVRPACGPGGVLRQPQRSREAEVSGLGILSPNTSLTDIVMEQQVDEIVVALAERRGGSMPCVNCWTASCRACGSSTWRPTSSKDAGPDPAGRRVGRMADLRRRLQPGLDAHRRQAHLRHRLLADPAGAGVPLIMLIAGLLILLESGFPDPLPAGARRPQRALVQRRQVPQHAHGRREGRQAALGDGAGRPRHPGWAHHPQAAHRRTAAALQRAQWRHEPGRPAAGAAFSSTS